MDKAKPLYIMFIADGCADLPMERLGGRTPLQVVPQRQMARLAGQSGVGMANTTPEGFAPGTETAIPLILGYDPSVLTGRGPTEAAGMGVPLAPGQFAMRCNLLRLDQNDAVLEACPELTDAQTDAVVDALLSDNTFCGLLSKLGWTFHRQKGFRQLITGDAATIPPTMAAPHNVMGQPMENFLPDHPLAELMRRGREILRAFPGANAIWPWGAGVVPDYAPFAARFGRGLAVSAVPVVRGIARLAGMDAPEIPGTTGTLHTNWRAKVKAVLEAAESGYEFVLLHLEAPDDCSHALNLEDEMASLCLQDEVCEALVQALGDRPFRLLLISDHVTSTDTGRHGAEPVPYCIFDSRLPDGVLSRFEETDAPVVHWDVPIRSLFEKNS